MNRLIIPILILTVLISCCQGNTKNTSDVKLAEEIVDDSEKNKSSIEETEISSPEIKMLRYLTNHFERIQDSTFLKKPDWMIGENKADSICGYVISFKEGHTFKHEQECVEWGEIVTVNFKGFTSDDVRKIVEDLFRNKNYNWYANSTEYRPKEYYETVWTFKITEQQEAIELEFSYSWI